MSILSTFESEQIGENTYLVTLLPLLFRPLLCKLGNVIDPRQKIDDAPTSIQISRIEYRLIECSA